MGYQHILLVTDLKDDADIVAQKAKLLLTTQEKSKLSVLHIVENSMVGVGYEYMSSSVFSEIDKIHKDDAQTKMAEFLNRNALQTEHADVTLAISNAISIVNYAQDNNVDVLVIGRHERHGLSAFLNGATADNILSSVKCDVLVVHLDVAK